MGEETALPELPKGWAWSTFKDVSNRVTVGHVGSMKNEYVEHGIPFLRSQNVRENRFDPSGLKYVSSEFHKRLKKSSLEPGDLVVVRSGSVGVACVIPDNLQDANCSDLVIVKQPQGIDPHYGAFYMNSVARARVNSQQVGVALIHFNTKSMAAMPIPVPPLAEQRRIVNKIEELFTQLDAGIDLLKKLKVKLKRYRQAVLKAAVEGKLTQDWREKQQQRGRLKSGDTLLAHIKTEREQCYQKLLDVWQTEVEFWEAHGKVGKRPSKPKKLKDLSALNQDDLSGLRILPDAWFWAKLGNVSIKIQIGPFGSLLHKADYIKEGIPAINPTHINDLKINVDTNFTVTQKKFDELKKYSLEEGDIIMGRRGEMGRCALVTENEDGFLCGTGSLYIRPAKSLNSLYYSYFLSSRDTKTYLERHSIGTTMRNLNENILNEIPVPVCSYLEQEKIVEEIEACFSICDRIETDITSDLKKSEKLRQSILQKAFEGKLVPQDPNDEPASLLLERIQAEKVQQEAKSKKRKATTKKKKSRKTTKTKQLEITDGSNEGQAS
ncbi:hypothetical protein D0962_30505 [Leptolyngbyaceae cyanobacterium CCMR0082]|uniref:Type I restriction modification DNA specificity domain-containing protein n=1 Tax=Adonisia turfae CCMR0082 TaxID=2304604 RepID=A0A6M0SGE5_9CYAN|nr:restriction endonuclease subunit S [Adonisia turfae]NEZ67033.1 hypothetical protein [Adonisia turfae CCMR0082]